MLIDWFTVAAQALNFLILVWLMKRVLYKPIMVAIAARETLVAAELADAAAKMSAADKSAAEFQTKIESFDRDCAALLAKATDDAKARSTHLLEAARLAADTLQGSRRDALQREMRDLGQALSRRAQLAFFSLARRAFKDLANGSLEGQVIALFCARLRAMSPEDMGKLGLALQSSSSPALIRSAFDVPPPLKDAIQTTVNDTFRRQIALRFEIAPQLISGVELTAQGLRVGWSIEEYLAAFDRDIAGALPVSAPVTKPPLPLLAVS